MVMPMRCPFPWKLALRNNGPKVGGTDRVMAELWLTENGWRIDNKWAMDPGDGDGWSIQYAIRKQAIREAQAILQPLGWILSSGSESTDGRWQIVFKIRKAGVGTMKLVAALRHENIQDGSYPPEAFR